MNQLEHIHNAFAIEHVPANIRASLFMRRWPLLRRYQQWPVGLALLSGVGRFVYRRAGQQRTVNFNGRNLQFHALYENHYQHGYELETALLMSTLIRGEGAFYDIGANWGYFSLLAATLPDFSGKIFSFEPNPRTHADLISTIEQAEVGDRVTPCHMGVGRTECTMTVAEADDRHNSGLSRLASDGEGALIAVKPIDQLGLPPPVLVKIDAEGMELDILRGAVRTLAHVKPFVVFENFRDLSSPEATYAPIRFLEENAYKAFLPVLEFRVNDESVLTTYGCNYTPLVAQAGQPRLGLVEVSPERRFLLDNQLNLLGVHVSRIGELWQLGIADFGRV